MPVQFKVQGRIVYNILNWIQFVFYNNEAEIERFSLEYSEMSR